MLHVQGVAEQTSDSTALANMAVGRANATIDVFDIVKEAVYFFFQ